MKKLMTLMLGMSLVFGSVALVFGQDTTTKKTTETTAKTTKKKNAKKVVKKTESTEKKS